MHSQKAGSFIEVREEGLSKKICVNDEHPVKDEYPIEVTEEGITICVNEEQFKKAEYLISVTE